MKWKHTVGRIVNPDRFTNIGLTAARRLTGQNIIYFHAETVAEIGNVSRLGIGPSNRGSADRINRAFRTGASNAIPEPLLLKLVLAIHEPVEHSCLAVGINVGR